jgi:hypothetical protein
MHPHRPKKISTVAIVLLGFGALATGCSTKRRSVSTLSTAAGASSGSTAPASSAGATSAIPTAPASQGNGLDAFNAELQVMWDELLPIVMDQLRQATATGLQGQRYSKGSLEVEIVNARLGRQTDMSVAPGLTRMDPTHLALRVPIRGTWTLALEADLRVRLSVGSFSPAIHLPVTIVLDDMTFDMAVDFDTSDPTRPTIQRVGQPQVHFTLKIDSSSSLLSQLTGALGRPANWFAQRALATGLAAVMPQLNGLQGLPGAVPADGAAPYVDSGVATPFEEVVENVELKIRAVHQPHGPLMLAIMDQPNTDSWLDGYRNGGPGVSGSVVGYEGSHDCAIFTGMYLAAESFRYAATGDSLALDSVGWTLSGVGALLDVNGGTGLLARIAAPVNSLAGQWLSKKTWYRSATIRGETWIGYQTAKGITRDQYSGVMFGLSVAYELVPQVRADAARRIEMILDYLIANDWVIDEDRAAWNGTNGSRGPVVWAGINYQKLACLLIGHRVNPAKYASPLAQAGPLAESAWIGLWLNTLGLEHYYKFNLADIGLFNYFRLETDPTRWQQLHRGYAMLRRYVGHHRNPHFDLIETSVDPHRRGVLWPSARESLRRFMNRNHRAVAPAVVDLSGVSWVSYTQTNYSNTRQGAFSAGTTTVQIPSEPLDIVLRKPTGQFLWQRGPFSPATPNQGDPHEEKHGLDLVLPYWMGRYLGAF